MTAIWHDDDNDHDTTRTQRTTRLLLMLCNTAIWAVVIWRCYR